MTLALIAWMSLSIAGAPAAHASGVPYHVGDVFAGIGNGVIGHFSPTGTLLDTLNTDSLSAEDTGMCFDAAGNLYSTNYDTRNMSKFDNAGNLVQFPFGSGLEPGSESCVFDQAGNVYVGSSTNQGGTSILKFSPTGALLATYSPATGVGGTDWIDLAADQCTMSYTSDGSSVKLFNVCTNTQLADFATGLPAPCYAHRIRANGEVLVACETEVVRLSATGTVLQTYPASSLPSSSFLYDLSLDPDGTSFWTDDWNSGQINRVDISSGTVITSFNAHEQIEGEGIAIFGEPTQGSGDTTPPSCALTGVIQGPPKQIQITVQDSDGGLAGPPNGVVVTGSTNATVSIPPYTAGDTNPLVVTATKIDQTQGSSVALQVTDVAGNVANCDPALLNIDRHTGKPASMTVQGIAKSEHLIHIYNGTPGVSTLSVDVNGKHFQVSGLSAGQTVTIDIGAALTNGTNSVTLTASGQPGGGVVAIVGDH